MSIFPGCLGGFVGEEGKEEGGDDGRYCSTRIYKRKRQILLIDIFGKLSFTLLINKLGGFKSLCSTLCSWQHAIPFSS